MSFPEEEMQENKSGVAWSYLGDAVILIAIFAALLLMTAPSRGDQEITVKPGRLKKIETTLTSKKFVWKSVGDYDCLPDSSGKSAIVLFPLPGEFTLLVIGAKADEPLLETITVKVEGEAPKPPPGPGPDPKPGPTPTGKIAHIVIIEETADATFERGQFFIANDLWRFVLDKGYKKTIVDKDVKDPAGQTPANLAPYIQEAKTKGTPYAFLVQADGLVLHRGAMAKTPAEFLSLLKKVGGE